jgi:lipopolysaccharide biosynthesis regulator YciM
MLKNIFSKLFRKKAKQEKKSNLNNSGLFGNIKKLNNFFSHQFQEAIDELKLTKERFGDLTDSNYEIALNHMEKGNVNDAIFRFKFIIRFLENSDMARYGLAYCYVLKNKFDKAEKILHDLEKNSGEFQFKAKELLLEIYDYQEQVLKEESYNKSIKK